MGLHLATNCTYCYTLEFNYHNGKRINILAPKLNIKTGKQEPETSITDPKSNLYKGVASPAFNIEIFEDCGRAFGAALLDLIEENPISRIPLSSYRSIANVKSDIAKNLDKYT